MLEMLQSCILKKLAYLLFFSASSINMLSYPINLVNDWTLTTNIAMHLLISRRNRAALIQSKQ
jgi:hypothetical protein